MPLLNFSPSAQPGETLLFHESGLRGLQRPTLASHTQGSRAVLSGHWSLGLPRVKVARPIYCLYVRPVLSPLLDWTFCRGRTNV